MTSGKVSAELITHPDVLKFRSQSIDDETRNLSFIQPLGYVLTDNYLQYHDRVQNFDVYEDDVWIATYPKCGTRWMQELVWCLRNGLESATQSPLNQRVPFFEFKVIDNKNINKKDSFEVIEALARPRNIKTHFPYDMLPKQVHLKKAKIINVIRNPRDVCLSRINHFQILENYTGDLQTIANVLTNDVGFTWGPYFKHVFSYWDHRSEDNLLIVSYEDMQKDLQSVIQKVAEFLNILITPEGVEHLATHLSFDSMKANPMINLQTEAHKTNKIGNTADSAKSIMKKGKTGRWKELFTTNMINQFETWEQKWMKDTDLRLQFEI